MRRMLPAGVSVVHTGHRQTGPTPYSIERFSKTYCEEALDACVFESIDQVRASLLLSWILDGEHTGCVAARPRTLKLLAVGFASRHDLYPPMGRLARRRAGRLFPHSDIDAVHAHGSLRTVTYRTAVWARRSVAMVMSPSHCWSAAQCCLSLSCQSTGRGRSCSPRSDAHSNRRGRAHRGLEPGAGSPRVRSHNSGSHGIKPRGD